MYFKVIWSRIGHNVLRLEHIPALYIRKLKGDDRYGWLGKDQKLTKFRKGEVIHIKEYDPGQSIYGIPQYMGGINSVLLNESATLFRRKYYDNGAHMGYIFYSTDPTLDDDDLEQWQENIKDSKGVGNFRSLFLNIPNGDPDGVKIIPIGEIATKDEFEKIKNLSRNDILSMWRVQPALAGIMPENTGGFGDIEKISKVYHENEIVPLQKDVQQLNGFLGAGQKIGFDKPIYTD